MLSHCTLQVFIRHDDPIFSCITLKIDSTLQLIHFSHFNGYSLNGYESLQKMHSSTGQNHYRRKVTECVLTIAEQQTDC